MSETRFDEWAVVELMGHQKMAGKVTEQAIGGASFVRIDVPELEGRAGFTRFVSPSAIYAINPCTEEMARAAAAYQQTEPIKRYELAALPAAEPAPFGGTDPDDGGFDYDEDLDG